MANENGKTVVKFLRDHEVQDEHRGTDKATWFRKGARKSLEDRSAQHFIERGIAVPAGPTKRRSKS
ncbi:hypothetical protein [Psychromarinibacter halotolerans]|uniref:Uncharacterized protein n=1 Tax=Psychromarinibacter halotolerans TaxID=1775175 RepID=A0ABV7GVN6_9RHOB|nr:hypothetical protein [Psychromarinibacter halotolerans]MAQ82245.1 hypothetical protein [Maritimibacter sp.]MDF0598984.1 hypothetical protein [Psychromarinibacter halotolerans]